jgi:hypothetical protein
MRRVLKITSLDFGRKLIHVNASLDYLTPKGGTPKSGPSAASVCMSDLLAKRLRDFLKRHHKPNPDGYLFTFKRQTIPVGQRRKIRSTPSNEQAW